MKKKLVFSLMFLFSILFLSSGGWLPSPVRLDTGDPPGDSYGAQISCWNDNVYAVWKDGRNGNEGVYFNYSTDRGMTWQMPDIRVDTGVSYSNPGGPWPQIACSGNNVYTVWRDNRNGNSDIFFNYSTNGGATWQTHDTRLDTGDPPGGNSSLEHQIACSGNNVYVVWRDNRNGNPDIYFNYSTNGGATWQTPDIRLDTGDPPAGPAIAMLPQIACSGNSVYAVWMDYRNGHPDIYFNYSTNGGATWQTHDIRLDTGDPPGEDFSHLPEITCSGNNVYVVWKDQRNGEHDIYFNYSTDGGATWQAPDIRLDTGDPPGASLSQSPQIACSGNNVYVVWCDFRNHSSGVYFNYSTDRGMTWQTPDIRLNTGDPYGGQYGMSPQLACSGDAVYAVMQGGPGISFNYSMDGGANWRMQDIPLDTGSSPQVTCTENDIYVVWGDYRNEWSDIFFNTASTPIPDIKANGSDGPITISRSDTLSITVEFDSGFMPGDEADWWLVAMTPLGWYYYDRTSGWLPGREVTLQIPLRDLPSREVLNMSGLPAGNYTFYFGVDFIKNGSINMGQAYYDSVEVTVNL